ncbi:MAG: c-type cytochrome [Limnobacter sp.]|uniref:c-type cytochrome n=1 Tax=unclassified Limnobacter TaxID=2630203 RepID=UPI000CF36E31|nr:c-type cytochrome [Limnobacter sp. SAORIC-690]PQJ24339.1 cytochrome c5 family protein [Limnobacter sp. SAORIC-690]
MSDSNEHELLIKTPKQLIYAVVAAFVIPIFVIILLAYYVSSSEKPAAGSNAFSEESIAARLAPVGTVDFVDANAPKVLKTGEQVYAAACAACHTAGAAGAPKTGDQGQWSARLSKGFDTLWQNAVNGIGAMPAKGGNSDLDDIEVARAVAYMGKQVGADFVAPEPAAPAAEAPAAEQAAEAAK